MTSNLLPCPCCGGKPMEMQYDGILWVQCEDCALNTAACDASADYVQLWNRRATQPAAGEPVAWCYPWRGGNSFTESREKIPQDYPCTPLFAAPPAAAHGDDGVQYRLLRAGEIIKATDELLRDDCASWQPMSDGPQLGIGREWHAGLVPMRRSDAAMRAQGDGEVK